MYMQRTLSQELLFSHSLGVGALQFSAPQPLCHVSHHHSNIILNKQEGNSEKCFMFFFGESFNDLSLQKTARREVLELPG